MDGDDEIEAGEDGTEAGNKDAGGGSHNVRIEVVGAERGGKGPAGIDTPEHKRGQCEETSDDQEVPTEKVYAGEGEVLCADHEGNQKIAQRCGNRRNQEEKDHDDPVHRKKLVIGIGGDQVGHGSEQLQPDEPGKDPSNHEKEANRDEIEDSYPFVVLGEKPATDAVFAVQIVPAGQDQRVCRGKSHQCGCHVLLLKNRLETRGMRGIGGYCGMLSEICFWMRPGVTPV